MVMVMTGYLCTVHAWRCDVSRRSVYKYTSYTSICNVCWQRLQYTLPHVASVTFAVHCLLRCCHVRRTHPRGGCSAQYWPTAVMTFVGIFPKCLYFTHVVSQTFAIYLRSHQGLDCIPRGFDMFTEHPTLLKTLAEPLKVLGDVYSSLK